MRWLVLSILLVGCDGTDETTAPSGPMQGTLALELSDTVHVMMETGAADGMAITLEPSADYGLLSTPLSGDGRVERFPEASSVLYTAKLSSPPQPTGPCGAEPVSLALSLHRQGENPMVVGGLTAYCGADRWYGIPKRVLRIAGVLTRP